MILILRLGGRDMGFIKGPTPQVRVWVEERYHAIAEGDSFMRLVFQVTLTVDIPPNDDELRVAFVDLITQAARQVYGPAAMLAKHAPKLDLTQTTREGKVEIPMFNVTQEGN